MDTKFQGLPAIAVKAKQHKFIIIAVMACVLILSVLWMMQDKKEEAAPQLEESFTIDAASLPVPKTASLEEKPVDDTKTIEAQPKEETEEMLAARLAVLQQKQDALQQRLAAPLMVVNASSEQKPSSEARQEPLKSNDPNVQFMLNAAYKDMQMEVATTMDALSYTVAEGRIIHAILEPAIHSDLPGSLRAVVSEPTYAEDGSRILIPRGSRLVGEYKNGIQQGQSRVFIVWHRLITPEGITVKLVSQGMDNLGVAGVAADQIDRHFWQRFGSASLLSMIGAGTTTLSNPESSSASYRAAVANSFAQTANQTFQYDGNIAPTLKTWQGKPIIVFVAKDLQFKDALQKVTPSINVF